LAQVLRPVIEHPASSHADLIVGVSAADDAGIYALGGGRALVQTIDIFTPVVDSAYEWGRIAAVNALSDVYAMGGTPLSALQYLAWPRDELPFDLAGDVVTGGLDVMESASCTVVGGHSIDSLEPTYGFAVTGLIDEDSIVTNSGARAGDALILTKPIGIGIVTTAIKKGVAPEPVVTEAIEVMTTLNDTAGSALGPHGATAATDVTGFGLLGHLREICEASGVGARVGIDDIPVIKGVVDLLADGMWAGGSQRNLRSIEPEVETQVARDQLKILVDAQTSGGLLVSLPEEAVPGYVSAVPGAVQIGEFTAGTGITVTS
jgi:selenide,water dikinase